MRNQLRIVGLFCLLAVYQLRGHAQGDLHVGITNYQSHFAYNGGLMVQYDLQHLSVFAVALQDVSRSYLGKGPRGGGLGLARRFTLQNTAFFSEVRALFTYMDNPWEQNTITEGMLLFGYGYQWKKVAFLAHFFGGYGTQRYPVFEIQEKFTLWNAGFSLSVLYSFPLDVLKKKKEK